MSQKATEMKTPKLYNVGEYLWRTTDNALFEIINVCVDITTKDLSSGSYTLKCVNNMNVAEHVVDREPETDLIVSIDMVHAPGSIYSSFQPSKPLKGQHVWNMNIIDRNKEFIVEDVKETGCEFPSDPCKRCHGGKCEQCHYGYRSKEDIAAELKASYKKPETIYTMVGIDGREQYRSSEEDFDKNWTMIPPVVQMNIDFDKHEKEVEAFINEQHEKESVETGLTVENSYEIWKKNLKVISVSKFDHDYFRRGLCYHVQKCGYGDCEFYGIMVSATEDLLKVMKLGTHINYENDTEIVEIPLKEYMGGLWHIVRLVEEA